jgi:aldehyde:ferredoxin oxidoreductase
MVFGYSGKILKVDLTNEKITSESTLKYKEFLGGRGIHIKILYDELKPGIDPLSPENILCLGTGPIGGTLAPSSGRYNATTKSPLTGFLGDSNSGGFWSPELKFAGYDSVVLYGRAKEPVYLWIDDDDVELRKAAKIWGRDTWETDEMIKGEVGDPEIQIASIGPAGEKLVRFACIINNLSRAAGKTGTGAVMGSKNLKAIAVRGTKGVQIAEPEKFKKICEDIRDKTKASSAYPAYSNWGTMLYIKSLFSIGMAPSYNWKSVVYPQVEEVYGDKWWEHWIKSKACFSCIMHCSHFYLVKDGRFAGTMGEGPEYEAGMAFGPKAGAHDKAVICYCNNLVNKYGLDVIDTGNAISSAMEWYEKGIITKEDTDGLALDWGNTDVMIELTNKIAKREGFGNLLAEGPLNAAKKIGKGAEYYVINIKGLGHEATDRRGFRGSALQHATSTRGADHMRGSPALEFGGMRLLVGREKIEDDFAKYIADRELFKYASNPREYRGKPPLVKWYQELYTVVDSLGLCKFVYSRWPDTSIYPEDLADLYSAATGLKMSGKEVMEAGERVYNLERAFIVREGIRRKDDRPPERYFKEPADGPAAGCVIEPDKFNEMLDQYYELRGWDKETGIPTPDRLKKLGLTEAAKDMEKLLSK